MPSKLAVRAQRFAAGPAAGERGVGLLEGSRFGGEQRGPKRKTAILGVPML